MRVVKNIQGDGEEFVAPRHGIRGCVKRGARRRGRGTLRIRIISRNMEKAHLEQCKEGTKIFQVLMVML